MKTPLGIPSLAAVALMLFGSVALKAQTPSRSPASKHDRIEIVMNSELAMTGDVAVLKLGKESVIHAHVLPTAVTAELIGTVLRMAKSMRDNPTSAIHLRATTRLRPLKPAERSGAAATAEKLKSGGTAARVTVMLSAN